MDKGYKCKFCGKLAKNKAFILKHEDLCSFNPKNKICWTCKHFYDDGYPILGTKSKCLIYKDYFKTMDEDIPCESWEQG